MNVWKVLGGVACLSVLLGTGALAEIVGGEPGTSKNPEDEDNVPEEIQRDTPSGGSFGKGGSGPGTRSDALTGMEKEKAVEVTEEGLEQKVEKTHGGSAAKAAQELEAQGEAKRSHNSGGAAKAAKDLKEEGEKSQKAISAQSAHQDMKKKLPKKDLEQADPPVRK